jgi:hypothetical protein
MAEQFEVLVIGGGGAWHAAATPESCGPVRRLRLLHMESWRGKTYEQAGS